LVFAEARSSRRGNVRISDLVACFVSLSITVLSGSASPALSNAARRWVCDAVPSPSSIRATSALRACLMSDMPLSV
jgi:hypothetical protein